jgi:hypothetical protein
MGKVKRVLSCLVFAMSLSGVQPAIADMIIPPYPGDSGEKYDPEILLPDLKNAIKDRAFLTTLEIIWSSTGELGEDLVSGDIIYFVADWLTRPGNAEWLAKKAYAKWGSEIDGILTDQSKTDEEKAAQLAALIERDIADFITPTEGGLNLRAKFAPNFRTYKLLWDRQQYDKTCVDYGWRLTGRTCESNQCYDQIFGTWVNYGSWYSIYEYGITSIERFYYEPDYKVYRSVNNVDKLMTTVQGYSQSANWMDFGDIWGELSGDGVKIPENGLIINDYDSDLARARGSSLSYKVVASTANYEPWCSSETHAANSTLNVDLDSDGDPDFVPWHVLHEDVLVALIVINTLLM